MQFGTDINGAQGNSNKYGDHLALNPATLAGESVKYHKPHILSCHQL